MKIKALVLLVGLLTLLVGTGIATADSLCRDSSLGPGNPVVDLLLGNILYHSYEVGTGSGSSCSSPDILCSGSCVNLTSDINNCGSCNFECLSGRAQPGCCSSNCTDLAFDMNNCGSCGTICMGSDPACCSGGCADLNSNPNHCGSCPTVCGGVEPGCCNANCFDLSSDNQNCGSCGNDCTTMGALFSCGGGICVCNDLTVMCTQDLDCCPGDMCFTGDPFGTCVGS